MKKKTFSIVTIIVTIIALLLVGTGFLIYFNAKPMKTGNKLGVAWYDPEGKEFTITTADELYEFAALSDYYNFVGQTVKLGADIVVNEGNAADWAEKAPAKKWAAISGFAGTFDGQGHTISGLYGKGFDTQVAMFVNATSGCKIQNFKLLNSYFEGDGYGGTASISTGGGGNFKRIYSEAIVVGIGEHTGGIVGKATLGTNLEECWFAGDITTTERTTGGIVGSVLASTVTMKHCLFDGKINQKHSESGARTGGLAGMVYEEGANLKIEDCLSAGKIESGNIYYAGSVVGVVYAKTAFDAKYSYAATSTYDVTIGRSGSSGTISGAAQAIYDNQLIGEKAYQWTNLDFEKYWTIVKEDTPILQCFAEEVLKVDGIERAFDISWYDKTKSEYVLTDLKDLYGFYMISAETNFKGKTVKLGADIVVNEGKAKDWLKGAEHAPANPWYPINSFAGTFDGQGHSISGIYFSSAVENTGLFAHTQVSAVVKNVKVLNSCMIHTGTSTAFIGSISGRGGGTFENIYSNAIIQCAGQQFGGLVGQVNLVGDNKFSNCWFDGELILTGGLARYAGGIVGTLVRGNNVISHCLNTGTITNKETVNTGMHLGGILGTTMNSGTVVLIEDCLNVGKIDTVYDVCVGAVVGRHQNGPKLTLKHTYATSESYQHPTNGFMGVGNNSAAWTGDVIEYAEADITGYLAYQWTTLDFNNYWAVQTKGTPILKQFASHVPSLAGKKKMVDVSWYKEDAKVMTIKTREQLYGFSIMSACDKFEEKTIKLGADIVMNGGNAANWASAAPEFKWNPIKNFYGTFDGQGHTISGIYLDTNSSYAGLFSKTMPGSVIKNFKVTNSYFNSKADMASLGSIAGEMGGTMDTVYSDAIVTANGTQVGGMVGRANYSGKHTFVINNCWFDGSVSVHTKEWKNIYAGGVVGCHVQGTLNMSNTLNTGDVTWVYDNIRVENGSEVFKAAYVGGLSGGSMNGKVLNADGSLVRETILNMTGCLNTGNVKVTGGGKNHPNGIGAIFGYSSAKGTVITLKDVYTVTGTCGKLYHHNASYITLNGSVIALSEKVMSGLGGYKYTMLDFDKYWAAVVNPDETPILKSFASTVPSVAGLEKLIDTSWYNKTDKEFTIDTLAELYGFYVMSMSDNFKGKTVKLGSDITINTGDAKNWASTAPGNEWFPISTLDKPFAGTFDGQGHTISGMYINSTERFLGLFSVTAKEAVVKNFSLKNSYIRSTVDAYPQSASIAGIANGTFDSIYSDAIVDVEGTYGAGMFARATSKASISNCWYDGTVTLRGKYGGGILGVNEGGDVTINNCLNTGTVISTYNKDHYPHIGGIIGSVTSKGAGTIKNCLNVGKIEVQGFTVASGNTVGAIIGRFAGNTVGTVQNAYYATSSCNWGISTNTEGKDRETGTAIIENSFTAMPDSYLVGENAYRLMNLDFVKYWVVLKDKAPELKSFSTGKAINTDGILKADTSWYDASKDKYVLKTAEELYGFALLSQSNEFIGKTIELGADITINNDMSNTKNVWMPIGQTAKFRGTFDGKMHTIKGIYVETDAQMAGFFAQTEINAVVKNLLLKDSVIKSTCTSAEAYVGSIAGVFCGDMMNVYSDATVTSVKNEVGGLIGRLSGNDTHKLDNLWFDGKVSVSKGIDIGGIIGRAFMGTTVMTNCLNTGNVTSTFVASDNIAYAGGFIGRIHTTMSNPTSVELKNSLNTGNVTASVGAGVGSVIGRARKTTTLTNVYTTENVKNTNGSVLTNNTVTGVGNYSTNGNTVNGACVILTEAKLKGAQARYHTALDFYTSETDDGVWVARKDATPTLKVFTKEADWYTKEEVVTADTSWYNASATEFVLTTSAQLYGLSQLSQSEASFSGKTIKLGADIVLNLGESKDWATKAPLNNWIPIGFGVSFAGTFDGQGHTISGMYINTANNYVGFIGKTTTTAVVKDFSIKNAYVNSTHAYAQAGSVIGQPAGTVSGIYSNAIVKTTGNYTGGMFGRTISNVTISSCWYDGTFTAANRFAGGILGHVASNTTNITNCLNTGKVVSTVAHNYPHVGGMIGAIEGTGSVANVTNCLNTGKIDIQGSTPNVNSAVGAIVGRYGGTNTTGTMTNVYFTADSCQWSTTNNTVGKITGTTTTITSSLGTKVEKTEIIGELAKAKLTGLDFTNAWMTVAGNVPVPKALAREVVLPDDVIIADTSWYDANPNATVFEISTAAQFMGISEVVKKDNLDGQTIKLIKDITLNTGDASTWKLSPPTNQFASIAKSTQFWGTFDGQGHKVSGVYINEGTAMTGLFGQMSGTVQNLRLENSFIYCGYTGEDSMVGSIAGFCSGNITNVYSNAIVESASDEVGGIVGRFGSTYTKTISKCWFDGIVYGHNLYAGGIIGQVNMGEKTIEDCLVTGTVNNDWATTNFPHTGGLVGGVYYTKPNASTVASTLHMKNCLSVGKMQVTGTSTVGAVIGRYAGSGTAVTLGTIENVYFSSDVYSLAISTNSQGDIKGTTTNIGETHFKKVEKSAITGEAAKTALTGFDFTNTWSVVPTKTPVLKSFAQ